MASTATTQPDAGGQGVGQLRHGEVEIDAERRGGDGHHGPRQDGEHHAVGQVVEHDQAPAADLLELEVKRQPRARGDGRGEEGPAQHREQVAEQQAEDEVEGADAGGQKQRADHQFRAGDVLAGELADVVLQPEQGLLRHRLALVFVYRVVMVAFGHLEITIALELLLVPGLPAARHTA